MLQTILVWLRFSKPELEVLEPTGIFGASIAASERYNADLMPPSGPTKFYRGPAGKLPYFTVPDHLA
jgi:hypothetical protein